MNRIIVFLTLGLGCDASTTVVPAKPPLKHIEIYGSQAIVELVDGVSARTVVGDDLFADFTSGQTPEEIAARFGKPLSVLKGDFATVFIYERQSKRVGVARLSIHQSGGGPPRTGFEIRAFPGDDFVTRLPEFLRELIQSESGLDEIHFRSTVRDGWGIHVHLQDRRVTYVSAVRLELQSSPYRSAGS